MFSFNRNHTKSWQKLESEYKRFKDAQMRDLFKQDEKRAAKYTLSVNDLTLDYSKNRFDEDVLNALTDLARERGVEAQRDAMFEGSKINSTENRAVLHIALRNRKNTPINVDGKNVMPQINDVLAKMKKFSDDVRYGKFKG